MKLKIFFSVILCGLAAIQLWAQQPAYLPNSNTADSVIKNDRGFRYMTTIDSALRYYNHKADSLINVQATPENGSSWGNSLARFLGSSVVRTIAWAMLGVFILFVVYRLFDFTSGAGRKTVNGDAGVAEDMELKNGEWYRERIEYAETNRDFRSAVRYRFMDLLFSLNDKGLIHFVPEKTNSAYTDEIKRMDLRLNFRNLKNIYDYVWYGKAAVDDSKYERVKDLFMETKKMI